MNQASPLARLMLLSKLHRATVTEADLHYEGSCGIDANLLLIAQIKEFERIELYNINNGERFSTYAIAAPANSGAISLNGAAARKAHVGDLLIICTYGFVAQDAIQGYEPTVVLLDALNQVKEVRKFQ